MHLARWYVAYAARATIVAALCAAALHDSDTGVRSAAVTALGVIDHESVFAPVLIALADDTREVRTAAARALSSLHLVLYKLDNTPAAV